jgi:tetratricopeptide (TPR) repeat protein
MMGRNHSNRIIRLTLFLFIFLDCSILLTQPLPASDIQGAMKLLEKRDPDSLSQAISIFQEALSTNPNQKEAHMGIVYARLIEYARSPQKDPRGLQEALGHADLVLKRNPEEEEAYIYKSQILFLLGKHSEGLNNLKTALKTLPESANLHVAQLVYWIHLEKADEAVRFSRQAALQIRNGTEFQIRIGDFWLQTGQVQLAKEHFARSLQIQETPLAWAAIGQSYMAEQDWEMAIKCFNQALQINPEYYPVYNFLTNCYIRMGKFSEAAEAQVLYVKAFPEDFPSLENLAVIYEKAGDRTKARLTWTKLRIQTKDPEQKQRAAEHINTLSRVNQ